MKTKKAPMIRTRFGDEVMIVGYDTHNTTCVCLTLDGDAITVNRHHICNSDAEIQRCLCESERILNDKVRSELKTILDSMTGGPTIADVVRRQRPCQT